MPNNPVGRPSLYTPELSSKICAEIATGDKSLRQICRELNIGHSTVLGWAIDNKEFADQYARAIKIGTDAQFDALEEEIAAVPERGKFGIDAAWVNWKRLQLDTRKWALSKRVPKKYGDKVQTEVSGPEGGPIEVRTLNDFYANPGPNPPKKDETGNS